MHIQIRDRHIYDFANESHDMLKGEERVSDFVVTVLSKVAISRSKCHRARPKSNRIVKNLDDYEIGRARADNTLVIARRLQTFRWR